MARPYRGAPGDQAPPSRDTAPGAMHLRLMTPTLASEDPRAPDVAEMLAELAAYLEDLYPEDEDDPPAPWTTDSLAAFGAFLVARIDGVPAACGGLAPMEDPQTLEIVRMYVRPAHRGLGLAGQILAALETEARARGATTLLLRCGPRQPAALKLYARTGYTQRAAFAQHREHETNVFLEKGL
ncbi:GNAT family N-acetyltransferase [Phenylobacterium sp.]|uniref:GNAT family N-acetyltransferase n=1 Tax=Phenylobacterium sp. TaxID=1871053 RepID=UPI00272200C2|nr:GNAT family N-acetyltransferase [Phenylobacterium sp.]MDO8800989.1 GNAT family N-acetyltransferase [Phenylobacterium sp.]